MLPAQVHKARLMARHGVQRPDPNTGHNKALKVAQAASNDWDQNTVSKQVPV